MNSLYSFIQRYLLGRAEYEHNLSQQVYFKQSSGQIVRNAKAAYEFTIKHFSSKCSGPKSPSYEFKVILETTRQLMKHPIALTINF